MNTTLKLTILTISTLLITACNNNNGKGKQNSAHGLINTPPKAQTQSIQADEDNNIDITIEAIDDDNDTIGYRVSTKPTHGKLSGKAPNLTYTPNKDYNGKDSFTFIANDGQADSKEAAVEIDITPVADLKGLKLTIQKKSLNKDTNISYTIEPVYDEGKISKELEGKLKEITIVSGTKEAIEVNKDTHTIKVLKDGNLSIQAKIDNITSNKETLQVYWEVNGHRLPPEPDPKINNSTLLGIDSNNNGVRDDVERWIYEEYRDKHPIYIDIAMQAGRAYKLVLEHPERAKEIRLKVNGPYFCGSYYMNYTKIFHKPVLVHERIDTPVKSQYFNTKARSDIYWQYDKALSGDSYDLPWSNEMKALCDFNTSKYEE